MTIQEMKAQKLLLFEAISGSTAYGTNLPTSDVDYKGVFIHSQEVFYSMKYPEQINDERNDQVYYEIRRFAELLSTCNPNMLELLAIPSDCIVVKHPLFDLFKPELFLSKLCKQTFAGYAMTQIRKARGLNKKIMTPMDKTRKSITDFCYVLLGKGAIPLKKWLNKNKLEAENCGLVNVPHMREIYALFYDKSGELGFSGIAKKATSNMVALSSIPKEADRRAVMAFNKDGYTAYCKQYRDYWAWVDKRNEERYKNTVSHGKNYDAKNMLHTFRLLDMAQDIVEKRAIIVRRPNRDYLLAIRRGEFDYDELVTEAEKRVIKIEALYEASDLPKAPNKKKVDELLVKIRQEWYR